MSSVTDFIYFLVHTHPYFFLQLSTEALSSWDWLLPCRSFDAWSSSCLFSKPGIWKSQAITTSLLVIKSGCCTTVALFSMRVILPVATQSSCLGPSHISLTVFFLLPLHSQSHLWEVLQGRCPVGYFQRNTPWLTPSCQAPLFLMIASKGGAVIYSC